MCVCVLYFDVYSLYITLTYGCISSSHCPAAAQQLQGPVLTSNSVCHLEIFGVFGKSGKTKFKKNVFLALGAFWIPATSALLTHKTSTFQTMSLSRTHYICSPLSPQVTRCRGRKGSSTKLRNQKVMNPYDLCLWYMYIYIYTWHYICMILYIYNHAWSVLYWIVLYCNVMQCNVM